MRQLGAVNGRGQQSLPAYLGERIASIPGATGRLQQALFNGLPT